MPSLTHAGEEAAAQSNHLLLPATELVRESFCKILLTGAPLDQSADVALLHDFFLFTSGFACRLLILLVLNFEGHRRWLESFFGGWGHNKTLFAGLYCIPTHRAGVRLASPLLLHVNNPVRCITTIAR